MSNICWSRPLAIVIGALFAVTAPPGSAAARPLAGGDPLWAVRWNGPANSYDDAYAVAASPDGMRVYVTGRSFRPSSDYDYVTFAYDSSTGAQIWASRYNGPADKFDGADSIGVSPDGSRVFVTGYSDGTGSYGGYDFATVAYDASNGVELWVARYDGPAHQDELDPHLAVSPDGSKVFVAGRSNTADVSEDFATVAYDATTGSTLWRQRYNGPGDGYDFAYAIASSADAVFVTGESIGAGGSYDYATLAYDAAGGSRLWKKRYNGPANATDSALSIAASPDGSKVFVTGYSGGAGSSFDYQTFAYDAAAGTVLWGQRYNGRANKEDKAVGVAVSPDGAHVYVTGTSYSVATGDDLVTVSYDASNGAGVWRRRLDGNGSGDAAMGLAARTNGVFVSGSMIKNGFDFLTAGYDPLSGNGLWVRRYNGPNGGHDIPYAIDSTSDGSKVFVTGYSNRALANEDYATVAYEG